jgi:hypothetical protein
MLEDKVASDWAARMTRRAVMLGLVALAVIRPSGGLDPLCACCGTPFTRGRRAALMIARTGHCAEDDLCPRCFGSAFRAQSEMRVASWEPNLQSDPLWISRLAYEKWQRKLPNLPPLAGSGPVSGRDILNRGMAKRV